MVIRKMELSDALRVSELGDQLGYASSESVTKSRISNLFTNPEHAGLVAELDGTVVGWIHVYVMHSLVSAASHVEIAGLVVDENHRGKGIGTVLVRAGEQWTLDRGYDDIRLRSAVKRAEAHEFYERLGFRVVKSQYRFEKKLSK